MNGRVGAHLGGILFPQFKRGFVAGHLHHMHRLRFPSVGFPRTAGFIETANWKDSIALQPTKRVDFFTFFLKARNANARNAARHAGEIFRNHGAAQTHSLEVQTTTI